MGGQKCIQVLFVVSFIKPISLLSGLDSAADFQLGYFPCQLSTPMSASFCPNDDGEDQYENTDGGKNTQKKYTKKIFMMQANMMV